jgi:formate C-acetyltransferase
MLADGSSAVKDLSFLCLEVAEELSLTRPQVGVRWNRQLGRESLERAVRVLRAGTGSPDFCNDEQIVPALVHAGIPLEDARDFCLSGCHEVAISGRSHMGACEGMFNMPKLLRMALGLEPRLREPAELSKIDSFEALWELLEREMTGMADVIHEVKTGATVDGRRTGESPASSLGPAAGRDRRGPTAMLNSVAKLPHV